MDRQIEKLIGRLQEVRIGLRKVEHLNLEHGGEKLTAEIIARLRTDQDVIDLAHQLLDGLVPGTDWAEEFQECSEDLDMHMQEMIEEREEFERAAEESEESGDGDNDPVIDRRTMVNELFDELGLSGSWLTLNEFMMEVGYPTFQDDYPFEIDYLIEAFENTLFKEDVDKHRLFLSGEMDQSIDNGDYAGIISTLLGASGDSRKNYKYSSSREYEGFPTVEGENTFLAKEAEEEGEDYVENFRALVSEALFYLEDDVDVEMPEKWKTIPDLDAHVDAMDLDELEEFYNELEDEIEDQQEYLLERREELMLKVDFIQEQLPEYEWLDDFGLDIGEIEAWVEEHEELLKGRKTYKRPRDYFDEQAVLAECGRNDPNSELEEIRYEQKKTDFCINPTAFKRLCQEVAQDFVELDEYNFEPGFFEALQVASEDYLRQHLEAANLEAIHANRTHIQPKDVQMAKRVANEVRGILPTQFSMY